MANAPEQSPPLLPVIPEYKPWLDRVIEETAADAKVADAAFASRHGPATGPAGVAASTPAGPAEEPRGAIADETA